MNVPAPGSELAGQKVAGAVGAARAPRQPRAYQAKTDRVPEKKAIHMLSITWNAAFAAAGPRAPSKLLRTRGSSTRS